MAKNKRTAIIVSASSDIGTAMCLRWLGAGWNILGTYRTGSSAVKKLTQKGVDLVECDLSDRGSIGNAISDIQLKCRGWDVLVLCPGSQEPVGAFIESKFDDWEKSIEVNFSGQMRLIHGLLPLRNIEHGLSPCVLFFAGGGTNNAVKNYSAYTVSKIALIKMCELLDAEISDTRFAIIGPGWVKTKIHNSTLKAVTKAGKNYKHTLTKLAGNECTPITEILDCCDWIINSSKQSVSGRNFSVVFDKWGTNELKKKLLEESDMYKLRRLGNDWLVKKERDNK